MKYLFNNRNQKAKIDEIVEIYNKISEENLYQTNKIILLVPNSATRLIYQKKLEQGFSEEIRIWTYINFIRKEITKYWPLIMNNSDEIIDNSMTPTFISNSLSQYILNDKVNKKRSLEGYFLDITSSNRSITNTISTNMNKSAQAKIDFTTIGEKIYSSKRNQDSIMRFSYSQMNEVINDYIELLLKNAILDDATSMYVYNKYLLTNDKYINDIKNNIEYIIVDSLENCTTSEVDFIDKISESCKDTYLYYDKTRDCSVFNNIDIQYIESKFKYLIEHNRDNISIQDMYVLPTKIELNESSQLYNEMIEEASNKVIELIEQGVNSSDIAIISPVNNTILDYEIKNILEKSNVKIFNTKKDIKLVEYPYMSALVVATCIFYDYMDLVKEEEHINFVEVIFNTNRIKAISIYNNQNENEEYRKLIKYIHNKKSENINISEFLTKFYIDKILNLPQGKKNVKAAKSIIQESEIFINSLKKLKVKKDKERIFIKALKTIINDFYSTVDINEEKNKESVIITTPYSYITHNINRPIHIWLDIGSNAWNMKIERDISNLIVLRKSFTDRKIYTDSMEESYKKYYLYNTIYNLLLNTEKVYAYKSEYSISGYIQESILYSLLLKLIDEDGDINE